MNLSIIPKDSIFQHWMTIGSMLETPNSFLLATAMSALGVLLRRNLWVSIAKGGDVYPNLSVLLVGKAGLGKDTAINIAMRQILYPFADDLNITAKTIEGMIDQLYTLQNVQGHNPACGYILAPELTKLFGAKEYQKSIASTVTDLLSTGMRFDDSSKGEGKRVIHNPTVSLIGGTTIQWLQKNMPENALEGGLIPRVLVIAESEAKRSMPRPNEEMTWDDRRAVENADREMEAGLKRVLQTYSIPREFTFDEEGGFAHDNWYHNRSNLFSPTVHDYAHRSRSQVSRMAMLCAASRCSPFMELCDVNFALEIIGEVAKTIDKIILPPTLEFRVAQNILPLLPAHSMQIIKVLSSKFDSSVILKALIMLRESGQAVQREGTWHVVEEEVPCYNGLGA